MLILLRCFTIIGQRISNLKKISNILVWVLGSFLYSLHAIYLSEISEKLSFLRFWSEFSEILGVFILKLSVFLWFWPKISFKNQFLGGLELSFWAKTEFLEIFKIWVFENPELSFLVLYKKKPVQHFGWVELAWTAL